jgi:hypothetical protein
MQVNAATSATRQNPVVVDMSASCGPLARMSCWVQSMTPASRFGGSNLLSRLAKRF